MTTATLEEISTKGILALMDEQLDIHQKEEIETKYRIIRNVLNNTLKGQSLHPTDITELVEKLKERKEEELKDAGLLISIAVNFTDTTLSKLVEINTTGFAKPLDYLGFRNNAPLHITGDAGNYLGTENMDKIRIRGESGNYLGYRMKSGEIIHKGDSGDFTGCKMEGGYIYIYGSTGLFCGSDMTHGEITIHGSTGTDSGEYMNGGMLTIHGNSRSPGKHMKGGSIIVYGHAEGTTGEYMEGGQIVVNGNIRNFASTIKSGTIYQGNKKIIANGKRQSWWDELKNSFLDNS